MDEIILNSSPMQLLGFVQPIVEKMAFIRDCCQGLNPIDNSSSILEILVACLCPIYFSDKKLFLRRFMEKIAILLRYLFLDGHSHEKCKKIKVSHN